MRSVLGAARFNQAARKRQAVRAEDNTAYLARFRGGSDTPDYRNAENSN
jgi:hypothetical protein